MAAQAPRVDRLTLSASGDGHSLRVDGAVVGPRLRGGLRARGTLAPGAADVSLQALSLDLATSRYRQVLSLRRPAQVRWRAPGLVTWTDVAVHGDGFRFTGDAVTSGLYRWSPSPATQPLARVDLRLRQGSFNGLTPVDAALAATLWPRQATVGLTAAVPSARAQLRLDAQLPVVASPGEKPRLGTRGPVQVTLRSNDVQLEALPFVQNALRRQGVSGGVATVNVTVAGDAARPDVNAVFALRDVMYRNLRGFGRDSRLKTVPGLGGTLTIATAPDAVRAGAVVRILGAGVLTVDARTPLPVRRLMTMTAADLRQAPVQATVTVPGFALASLAQFTDDMKGISGHLSGQGQVTGTFSRPSGTATLQITDGKIDDLAFGQVSLTGHASDGRVDAALVVHDRTGGSLNGSAVLDRRQGDRLQATVDARDLNLCFARLFAPSLRETAGVAQLTARASGTLASPVLNAALTVEQGRVGLIGQPTFRDVRLAATLRPGRADLTRLEAHSGAGSLSGNGWVSLDGLTPRRAVFTLHAHRFLVAAAGSTGALLDGELAADAVLRQDLLAGRVQVPQAHIWLPKGPGAGSTRDLQKIGQHNDVRFVDQAAQAAAERQRAQAAAARPTALDVGVRTGPIYLRGKDLDLQLDSTLTVATVPSGPRAGAPTVGGGIHVRHGRINIQGQRFDFARGEITFDGSPDINPRLDIMLERQYPDAQVLVELRGTPKKPQLRMTSDPPVYDQAQIVSLILTGQPGGQPSGGRAFDPTAAVVTAVLSKLADKLAPELGLDVLRVEKVEQRDDEGAPTGDANTRVEVGKYVTDRIYLSYAHVFAAADNANQNEAHVEYRLSRRWIVETIFGDAGVGGADALWTVRY